MTNEELIDGQMCQCCSQRRECVHGTRNRCTEYDDAIELLKEKDSQFKGHLEKKLKSNAIPIIDELSIKTVTPVFIAIVRRHLLREIINELFKED